MVIYHLQIHVDPAIEQTYLEWLRPHMHEVKKVGGFKDAQLYKVEAVSSFYIVLYEIESREKLELYFRDFAPSFRADALARFGDKVKIERQVLQNVG
jgi:hypothetical protein